MKLILFCEAIEQEKMEYSSGCESGWTMYLDQSANQELGLAAKGGYHQVEEEEEEDLSMVSDASSVPAMFIDGEEEDENYYIGNLCPRQVPLAGLDDWRNDSRMRIQRKRLEKYDPLVDDTASSYALGRVKNDLGFTNKNVQLEDTVDFSMGFSLNAYKGKSDFQDHFSYLQMPLAKVAKGTPAKSVCKKERRNKKW